MAKRQTQKVKGCKKAGRNRAWCEAYRKRGQREINKRKKIIKHMKRFPNDRVAERALARFI